MAEGSSSSLPRVHFGPEALSPSRHIDDSVNDCRRAVNVRDFLLGQLSTLIFALRSNPKYSQATRFEHEIPKEMESKLMRSANSLRSKLWREKVEAGVSDLSGTDYVGRFSTTLTWSHAVSPFVDAIRAEDASGPITGIALAILSKLLSHEFIDLEDAGAADAMKKIMNAAINCRFERTDARSDEVVLHKLLQLMVGAMRCKANVLISSDVVWETVRTCFTISRQPRASELLMRMAENTLMEIVYLLFLRLKDPNLCDTFMYCPSSQEASAPKQDTSSSKAEKAAESAPQKTDESKDQSEEQSTTTPEQAEQQSSDEVEKEKEAGDQPAEGAKAAVLEKSSSPPPKLSDIHSGSESAHDADTEGEVSDMSDAEALMRKVGTGGNGISGITRRRSRSEKRNGDTRDGFTRIVQFVCELLDPWRTESSLSLRILGLNLLQTIVSAAGEDIYRHERVLDLMVTDVCQVLMQNGQSAQNESVIILSHTLRVIFQFVMTLREHRKVLLEIFILNIYLPIGMSKSCPFEHQELVLESLVEICSSPDLTVELFVNYDCERFSTNLLENLARFLSKMAFPVNGGLSVLHTLALTALLHIVHSIEQRCMSSDSAASIMEGAMSKTLVDLKEIARQERVMKQAFANVVEQFNKKPKKALETLREMKVDGKPLTTEDIARFMRFTEGLDREQVGTVLGDHDQFSLQLLEDYTKTFAFQGLDIQDALRMLLHSFRLPGEAQKIDRIVQSFGIHYNESQVGPARIMTNDASHVLSFAMIMLNTDQHNDQVKHKMKRDDFIRNVRGINDGEDLPKDMLIRIFKSISENEIKTSKNIIVNPDMSSACWRDLLNRCEALRPYEYFSLDESSLLRRSAFDQEMFTVIWGPTIAALTAVFDTTDDADTLAETVKGLYACARISTTFQMRDVFDNLVIALCKFSNQVLTPSLDKAVANFGRSEKAQLALETAFSIVRTHSDHLREGWKNILEVMIRIFQLGLMPSTLLELEDFLRAPESRQILLPQHNTSKRMANSGSFLFGFFGGASNEDASSVDKAAEEQARRSIDRCKISELLEASFELEKESLIYFVKALIRASGGGKLAPAKSEAEHTAVFCMELLTTVCIVNRDRIHLLWGIVYEHFARILGAAHEPSMLVERAVVNLMRIVIDGLQGRDDSRPEVCKALRVFTTLDNPVAHHICPQLMGGLMTFFVDRSGGDWFHQSSTSNIGGAEGEPKTSVMSYEEQANSMWNTVFILLKYASRHPEAWQQGFDTVTYLVQDSGLLEVVEPLIERCVDALVAYTSCTRHDLQRGFALLDLCAVLHDTLMIRLEERYRLVQRAGHARDGQNMMTGKRILQVNATSSGNRGMRPMHSIVRVELEDGLIGVKDKWSDSFYSLLCALTALCCHPSSHIRSQALIDLQRTLLDDSLRVLAPSVWEHVFQQIIFPLLEDLLTLSDVAVPLPPGHTPADVAKPAATATREAKDDSEVTSPRRRATSLQVPSQSGRSVSAPGSRTHSRSPSPSPYRPREQVSASQSNSLASLSDGGRSREDSPDGAGGRSSRPSRSRRQRSVDVPTVDSARLQVIYIHELEETQLRAINVVSRVFLQYISELVQLRDFHSSWMQIIRFMQKYMNQNRPKSRSADRGGDSHSEGNLLADAIPETIKNMLLVMLGGDYFSKAASNCGENILELTWTVLDTFCPNMRSEVMVQNGDDDEESPAQSSDQPAEAEAIAADGAAGLAGRRGAPMLVVETECERGRSRTRSARAAVDAFAVYQERRSPGAGVPQLMVDEAD